MGGEWGLGAATDDGSAAAEPPRILQRPAAERLHGRLSAGAAVLLRRLHLHALGLARRSSSSACLPALLDLLHPLERAGVARLAGRPRRAHLRRRRHFLLRSIAAALAALPLRDRLHGRRSTPCRTARKISTRRSCRSSTASRPAALRCSQSSPRSARSSAAIALRHALATLRPPRRRHDLLRARRRARFRFGH